MNTIFAFITVTLALLNISNADVEIFKGQSDNGQVLSAQCAQCHGANGITNHGMHPNLAGQNEKYLIRQLMAFKADTRMGHHMNEIAKGLSEQDIYDLAAYYSQINICE